MIAKTEAHPLAMFDEVLIINLVNRPDRRQDMTRQIEKIGGFANNIRFHDAHRPTDAAGFFSIGTHGCFMSHYNALSGALARGAESVLIIEDDFNFSADFLSAGVTQLNWLRDRKWDIFQGNYRIDNGAVQAKIPLTPKEALQLASFIAFNGETLGQIVAYLEGLLKGEGPGRIPVDGAYTEFRWANSDVVAFAADPQLGYQRSSVSSITPSLIDRLPIVNLVVRLLRRLKNR